MNHNVDFYQFSCLHCHLYFITGNIFRCLIRYDWLPSAPCWSLADVKAVLFNKMQITPNGLIHCLENIFAIDFQYSIFDSVFLKGKIFQRFLNKILPSLNIKWYSEEVLLNECSFIGKHSLIFTVFLIPPHVPLQELPMVAAISPLSAALSDKPAGLAASPFPCRSDQRSCWMQTLYCTVNGQPGILWMERITCSQHLPELIFPT